MSRNSNIAQEIQLVSHGFKILSGMAKEKHIYCTLLGLPHHIIMTIWVFPAPKSTIEILQLLMIVSVRSPYPAELLS